MFSRVLFFLVKISLRASFTLNMVLLVENYSKSLQKLEDGIILVQLVIRVILQELKCLCHVREWTSYPCQRNRRLCRMNPVNEWKYRECPRCFRATKCAGGIHTDVLDIFPHAQTNPDGCRWIQSDHVMEKPYHYDKNIRIHCVDENLTASFVHRVLNMYSNSRVGFLMVASLYICRTSAWDDWFIWGGLLPCSRETGSLQPACQEGKELFLVGIVLKKCFPVWRNLGVTCHLSSLTFISLLSGWILDAVRLVHIPNNVHLFTWLEMIHNEWDKDVFSIAIKGGNSCGWKGMNNSCSIKDLTIIDWRWIKLLCTGRLNTCQEVGLLPES